MRVLAPLPSTGTVRNLALVGIVVLSVLTVAVGPAAAATTFTYANNSQYPASTTTGEVGQTYQHEIAVETNASNGPIELVMFYNKSAAISYQSHTATLGGTTVSMQANTSTVIVNGQQLTRVRFVHRFPSVSSTETLRLTANLSMPNAATSESIYVGGTHAPSGTTLPRRLTTVDVSRPDLTVTRTSTSPSPPTVGQSTIVTATIDNVGGIDAGSTAVDLLVNGSVVGTNSTTVTAGSSSTVTFSWTPSTSGKRNLTIVSDAKGVVTELSESNNASTKIVNVASDGSGGGGGGGGGGGAPAAPATTPSVIDSKSNLETVDIGSDAEMAVAEQAEPVDRAVSFVGETNVMRVKLQGMADNVAVVRYDEPPQNLPETPGRTGTLTQIAVDGPAAEDPGTVKMRVYKSTLEAADASPEDVQIARYDASDGEWSMLDIKITNETDDAVLVKAETAHFSYFATVIPTEKINTSGEDSPANETEDTGEERQTPGFEVVIAVVVLLSAAFLARARR